MKRRIIPEVAGYNKVDVVSFMKMKITSNVEWAKRACLAIYDQQTMREKKAHISMGHNGNGFGRLDCPVLTKIACKIRQNRATIEDLERLQRMMPRYAKQLICLAHDKDECKNLKKHLDFYFKDSKKNVPY